MTMKLKQILISLLAVTSLSAYAQLGVTVDQAKAAGIAVKPDTAVKPAQLPAPAVLPSADLGKVKTQPYMPTSSHRIVEPPKSSATAKPAAPITMKKIVTSAADDPATEEEIVPAGGSAAMGNPAIQKLVADKLNGAIAANDARFATEASAPISGFPGTAVELKNDFVVRNGVTEIIKIPKNFLTRMITPFAKPEAKSVNEVEVEVVGSTLYVTPTSDQPIGLFVYDTEDPTSAMTLQLIPQDIPQRDISLRLVGTRPGQLRGGDVRGGGTSATSDRGSQPYTTSIVELMGDVAKGRVPTGYTLANPVGNEADCIIPGVKATLGQLIDGQRRKIAVMVLENQTSKSIEVNEQACYRSGVVGVSIWPNPVISPGQQTEAYILMSHEDPTFDTGSMRPRLVK